MWPALSIFRAHNINSPSSSIISTVVVPVVLLTSTSPLPVRVTVKVSVPSTLLSPRIVMLVQDCVSPLWNDPIAWLRVKSLESKSDKTAQVIQILWPKRTGSSQTLVSYKDSMMVKGGFILAWWVGRACYQKAFQTTIPDSQGQVSSNRLCYRV